MAVALRGRKRRGFLTRRVDGKRAIMKPGWVDTEGGRKNPPPFGVTAAKCTASGTRAIPRSGNEAFRKVDLAPLLPELL